MKTPLLVIVVITALISMTFEPIWLLGGPWAAWRWLTCPGAGIWSSTCGPYTTCFIATRAWAVIGIALVICLIYLLKRRLIKGAV